MSFAGLQVDDLCHGANDWRNIQEVVRASFKIFYDVICDQSERIQQLTTALTDVNAALAEKVKHGLANTFSLTNIGKQTIRRRYCSRVAYFC